jgi:hypothetical protein
VHDVLKVLDRARQAIDAGDDQRIAGPQEFEQSLQLGAPVAARAAFCLGANYRTARRLQCRLLEREVLVEGGHPGVAVEGHRKRECLVSF